MATTPELARLYRRKWLYVLLAMLPAVTVSAVILFELIGDGEGVAFGVVVAVLCGCLTVLLCSRNHVRQIIGSVLSFLVTLCLSLFLILMLGDLIGGITTSALSSEPDFFGYLTIFASLFSVSLLGFIGNSKLNRTERRIREEKKGILASTSGDDPRQSP